MPCKGGAAIKVAEIDHTQSGKVATSVDLH